MEFSLESKYVTQDGTILISGVQALVRLPMDQHRADRRAGLRTATLVSGYRGSPLGGLDHELQRRERLLRDHEIRFLPGVNEDLGATAVFGSQMAGLFPRPKYDGVLGMWYGKALGVDRSGDVFKHANFAGVGRTGGVLAVAGDDATAKSSTLPSQSEAAFYDALMPVLSPGSVQEVLDLGRLGFEMSRYSGLWVGFKMATSVADAYGTAQVSPDRIVVVDPQFEFDGQPWRATQSVFLAPPMSLTLEREIHVGRLEAARAFSRAHALNRVTVSTPRDRLGIAAPGKTYFDLREALAHLGLDDEALRAHGIRLLKVAMPYPLETETVKEFAHGLEEILVVEEKRSFLELFLKEALYNEREGPRIVGKRDEAENPLVPASGELDPDTLTEILARRLASRVPEAKLAPRLGILGFVREQTEAPLASQRLFHFCSGCPHNRSTMVPEGSLAGAGIGCHAMAMMMDDRSTVGITHMGGEGVQWVGMAPFTETEHLFQNLGDGTLFHSGTLAIRQAVAAGTNITFKILYNGAVAMTGGQDVDGAMPIPELTRVLEAEGVQKILVLSDEPRKLAGVDAWHRDRLDEAQQLLRETPGMSVLIYDQHCAAELRRKRRRGVAPEPKERIFINEAVCEGCGDCGVQSSCLSLFPVETELGRKTQVHQASCNKDDSCLEGDCPSFLRVIPGGARPSAPRSSFEEVALPSPDLRVKEAHIYMVAIGGTGVVTANQILATAAMLEDKHATGVDQTGLSQKAGPVVSHLKILESEAGVSNTIAAGDADVYLAFDILASAAPGHLSRARSDKTTAVVSTSRIPTGRMVTHVDEAFPELDQLASRIDAHTRFENNVYLDATALAEHFFSDHMPANVILLGAAYQQGLLPVKRWSLEKAIELNGVAVERNRQAFSIGRRAVADPDWVGSLELTRRERLDETPKLEGEALALVDGTGASGELRRLLAHRVPELIAYQNTAYASRYVELVERVASTETARVGNGARLSEAVARNLFKLMAYKDEYEVARLHTKPELTASVARTFGDRTRWKLMLLPPFLRAIGVKHKIPFGPWFRPILNTLARLKFLRGTALDPFGHTAIRRIERTLINEYRNIIEKELVSLSKERYNAAVELAELPALIRGYEAVKLRTIERYRNAVRQKLPPQS